MLHRNWRFKSVRLITLAVMICFGSLFWPANPGKADVGPSPWAPGNSIGPANPTRVRMVKEYVQIDLLERGEVDSARVRFPESGFIAQVQADFTMQNLGPAAEEMAVYFPLGIIYDYGTGYLDMTIKDFAVWVNDQPAPVEHVVVTDQQSPQKKYISASFPVRFPTARETLIHVTYTFGSKFVPGVGSMESISYIFETGAGWNDTIGKAVLVVNLPDTGSQESVTEAPAGGKADGRSITWTWTNLEPTSADNFWMVLVDPTSWQQVRAARQRIKASPNDGALWTELGGHYVELATGKWSVEYPYFARLAKEALQKAVQLSPDDREPHRLLFYLYGNQAQLWVREQQTQAECEQLVAEINGFLVRTAAGPGYDRDLEFLLESYNQAIDCPNKPKLTERRGVYPTLTATPEQTATPEPTQIPSIEATWEAYENVQDTRVAGMLSTNTPVSLPTKTLLPTEAVTLTRTPMRTHSSTLAPSQTASATSVPQAQTSSTPAPAPAKANDDWLVFGGILVVGGVMLGTAYAWQYFYKKSLAKRNARF